MALLPIIVAPDPRLKLRCAPVTRVDAGVRRLMDDMLETMYEAPGVGLSAPQVGETRRVIVVDATPRDGPRGPLRMANPEIISAARELAPREEGCLSFPDQFADVERPAAVRIRYLDEENEIREIDAKGLLAACVQHEIDHLDGVLFVDHLTALRRGMILRKMQKAKRMKAKEAAA